MKCLVYLLCLISYCAQSQAQSYPSTPYLLPSFPLGNTFVYHTHAFPQKAVKNQAFQKATLYEMHINPRPDTFLLEEYEMPIIRAGYKVTKDTFFHFSFDAEGRLDERIRYKASDSLTNVYHYLGDSPKLLKSVETHSDVTILDKARSKETHYTYQDSSTHLIQLDEIYNYVTMQEEFFTKREVSKQQIITHSLSFDSVSAEQLKHRTSKETHKTLIGRSAATSKKNNHYAYIYNKELKKYDMTTFCKNQGQILHHIETTDSSWTETRYACADYDASQYRSTWKYQKTIWLDEKKRPTKIIMNTLIGSRRYISTLDFHYNHKDLLTAIAVYKNAYTRNLYKIRYETELE